jgi:integrase
VDANRTLAALARERDLSRNTLRRIKSVLSTIFIYAKNVGAFDGANPVTGAFIPKNARDPKETRAYDLAQVAQMLEVLPLLAKALVATVAFAGLRHGELRGLHCTDYTGRWPVLEPRGRSLLRDPHYTGPRQRPWYKPIAGGKAIYQQLGGGL